MERFLLLESNIQDLMYQDERAVNLYDLIYEEDRLFVIEPHYERVCIKFKNALADLDYREWRDYIHIFSGAIHQDVIVRYTDCIDINLGVSWSQDQDGFTVYGSTGEDTYTIVTLGGSTTYADQLAYANAGQSCCITCAVKTDIKCVFYAEECRHWIQRRN